jgi:hypothetical protein
MRRGPVAVENSLRDLYDASGFAIAHLYAAAPHHIGMAILQGSYTGMRSIGFIAAADLFLLALFELLHADGGDANMWRGIALSALYLCVCLGRRRATSSSSSSIPVGLSHRLIK